MKEATGELSMTAIVVVIIGVIALAAPPIVRGVINSAGRSAQCQAAFGCISQGNNKYSCSYVDDTGATKDGLICSGDDIGLSDPSGAAAATPDPE